MNRAAPSVYLATPYGLRRSTWIQLGRGLRKNSEGRRAQNAILVSAFWTSVRCIGLVTGSPHRTQVVGAGVKVLQISRFENARGSSRRATHARSDVGQGLTNLSLLVAGIAARMAPAAEEILAELDQEPRGGRQVIL